MIGFRPFFNPATGEWIEYTAVADDTGGADGAPKPRLIVTADATVTRFGLASCHCCAQFSAKFRFVASETQLAACGSPACAESDRDRGRRQSCVFFG